MDGNSKWATGTEIDGNASVWNLLTYPTDRAYAAGSRNGYHCALFASVDHLTERCHMIPDTTDIRFPLSIFCLLIPITNCKPGRSSNWSKKSLSNAENAGIADES